WRNLSHGLAYVCHVGGVFYRENFSADSRAVRAPSASPRASRAWAIRRQFSARSALSLPAQKLERAATLSACTNCPCCSRTRASSCHSRGLRGSMRSARSIEAAAVESFPAAASARADSTNPATATFSEREIGGGTGSAVGGGGAWGTGWG